MGCHGRGLGRDGERMVEGMSLQELVVRRCRDYGYETPRQLAEAAGMHINNIRLLWTGNMEIRALKCAEGWSGRWIWTRE